MARAGHVRRSYAAAFRHWREAAEPGYPSAAGMVGTFHAMARPKHDAWELDPDAAARWHRRAAEHDNGGAPLNLASAYWTGLGVPVSAVEAYVWASVSVHCAPLRIRPAEVPRKQSATGLNPAEKTAADERIARRTADLPKPGSERMGCWRMLVERSGVTDPTPNA